jgi:hypothetical protein
MNRLLTVLMVCLTASAEIIPSDRRVTWAGNVGLVGGIPTYAVYTNLYPSGDATTDTAAINGALADAPHQGRIYLNNGAWRLNGIIDFANVGTNGVELAGNGRQTRFIVEAGGRIEMRSTYYEDGLLNYSVRLRESAVKGATTLELESVPSWIKAGNTYLLDQLDDEVYASNESGEDLNVYRNTVGYGQSRIGTFATDVSGWTLASGSDGGSAVSWDSADAASSVSSGSASLAGNFGVGNGQAGLSYTFGTPEDVEADYTRIYLYVKVAGGSTLTTAGDYGHVTVVLKNGAGLTEVPLEAFTINTAEASAWRLINVNVQGVSGLSDVRQLEVRLSADDYLGPVEVLLDSIYLVGARGANHMVKVLSKTTTNVVVEVPMVWDWTTNLHAELSMAGYDAENDHQIKRCGIRDIWFEAEYGSTDVNFIKLENADECWVKNVGIINQPGRSAIISFWGYRLQIEDCFLWDSHYFGGGQGYGVNLYTGTFGCLVQNCVIRRSHLGVALNYGATGNVVGYCFIFDSEADANQAPSIGGHGAHSMFNLIEGNVCEDKIMGDFVHGSASHNTVHRNKVAGTSFTGVFDQTAISIEKWNRAWNFTGNVLGTEGVHTNYSLGNDASYTLNDAGDCANEVTSIFKWGYPRNYACSYLVDDLVSDTPAELDALLHGNWDVVTNMVVWDGTIADHALPESYYLSGEPDWWDDYGAVPWPAVEPTTTTLENMEEITNPAKLRYELSLVPPTYIEVRPRGSLVPGNIFRRKF